jgi:hypothetical protein
MKPVRHRVQRNSPTYPIPGQPIQFIFSQPIYLRSILMYFNLSLGFSTGHFLGCFPTKILYIFLVSPCELHISFFSDVIILKHCVQSTHCETSYYVVFPNFLISLGFTSPPRTLLSNILHLSHSESQTTHKSCRYILKSTFWKYRSSEFHV